MSTDSEVERRVREILADVLGLDPHDIGESCAFDRTPRWDSANHVCLVAALEEEFSIVLSVKEIEAMLTFPEVVQTVAGRI